MAVNLREWARMGDNGRQWARMGENGRQWARMGKLKICIHRVLKFVYHAV